MFGSCFIENIGRQLIDSKFNVNLNPFGILYNPQSISQAIRILIADQRFTKQDLFHYNGGYHSFLHHGSFSDTDRDKCLDKINKALDLARDDLFTAGTLIITFGTAYVFRFKEKDMVVGNCHKLPAANFDRYRLDVDSFVADWNQLLIELKQINPQIRVLFTVSPIRHMNDGAHQNQLSKATLMLAIDKLREMNSDIIYFPSYEIMLDELRDYRFYNEDMVHPSHTAIKYIWQRFSEVYFDDETSKTISEWEKIRLAINHRPSDSRSEEYKQFLRQTLLKLKTFDEKYTYICCTEEIFHLQSMLDQLTQE